MIDFKEMNNEFLSNQEFLFHYLNDLRKKKTLVQIDGCEKVWADGKIGTISDVHLGSIEKGEDPNTIYVVVSIESMDKSIPPFGLVSVRSDQIKVVDSPELESLPNDISENDSVNHPTHYTDGKYEVIDFIESQGWQDNFYIGNAIKYLSRAGKKDPAKKQEDINKAIWYLKRSIEHCSKVTNDEIPVIDVKEFIKDKGLENTPQGVAISLIFKDAIEEAIEVLQIKND